MPNPTPTPTPTPAPGTTPASSVGAPSGMPNAPASGTGTYGTTTPPAPGTAGAPTGAPAAPIPESNTPANAPPYANLWDAQQTPPTNPAATPDASGVPPATQQQPAPQQQQSPAEVLTNHVNSLNLMGGIDVVAIQAELQENKTDALMNAIQTTAQNAYNYT